MTLVSLPSSQATPIWHPIGSKTRCALLQVSTPPRARKPFVAGFLWDPMTDRVVSAAPILRRPLMGKTAAEVAAICDAKGWRLSRVLA